MTLPTLCARPAGWLLALVCQTALVAADTVTFDAGTLGEARRGRIGFLHSIAPDALPLDWVTDLKPFIWRGTIKPLGKHWAATTGLAGAEGYRFLKEKVGVRRQIFIFDGKRRTFKDQPYRSIREAQGYEAAVEAYVRDCRQAGLDYEWDIMNEPDFADMDQYMNQVWIPTFRAIRRVDPGARIHGPSSSMVPKVLEGCHEKFFAFLERAARSGTLPDVVTWHFQDGYDIATSHGQLAAEIRAFYQAKGQPAPDVVCGETVRPGDERNTSPAVAIDVFAAAELHDITQIHAAWGSTPVYGQNVNPVPVLDGLLTKDSSGRRGVWWTYRFYAQSTGRRLACVEGPSGSDRLVALGFAEPDRGHVRAMIGVRDGIKTPVPASITLQHLSRLPGLAHAQAVRIRTWDNPQTETATTLDQPTSDERLPVVDDGITLTRELPRWGAVLVDLTPATP